MNSKLYFVDGKWCSPRETLLPVNDLSVVRGVGLFESIRVYNKTAFLLSKHIDRLIKSADRSQFVKVPGKKTLHALVAEGIDLNSRQIGPDMAVRIILTAGSGTLSKFASTRVILMFDKLKTPSGLKYSQGLKLMSYSGPRFLASHKHCDYFFAARGLHHAAGKGFDDIVYRDTSDNIYESSTGNIFIFNGKRLITPKRSILAGLTRSMVIDRLAPKIGLDTEQRKVSYSELIHSDEVFLTGSLKEIIGVKQIDQYHISTRSGEITNALHREYKRLTY